MATSNQIDILLKVSADTAAIRKTQSEMQGFQTRMSAFSSKLKEGLGLAAGTLALGGAAAGLKALGTAAASFVADGVRFNAMLEEQRLAFTHLTGSAEEATKRVAELQRLAAETPFDLAAWRQASVTLQNLGGNALAGRDGLRLVGNVAAATGRPLEQLAQTIGRLHAGLTTGGSVSDVTTQLQHMGAISIEAKQRLDSLAAAKIAGPAAWAEATTALGRFSGAMDQSQHGWDGLMRQISASWEATKGKLTEPVFEPMTQGVRNLATAIGLLPTQAQAAVNAIREAGESLGKGVETVTTATLPNLRGDLRSQRAAARLQLANLNQRRTNAGTTFLGIGGEDTQLKEQKATLQKTIDELSLKLVEFDGLTKASF